MLQHQFDCHSHDGLISVVLTEKIDYVTNANCHEKKKQI
jgi:hypothetical protein